MAEQRMAGKAVAAPARYINTVGTDQTDTEAAEVTYRGGPGEPKVVEAYGTTFRVGESKLVSGKFVDKAKGNPFFGVKGEKTYGDEQIEAEAEEVEQEEASFEDNVARERREEYLETANVGSNFPGDADRVQRAREQAIELQAAKDDDEDSDKPARRRGRPPKSAE